MTVGQMGGVEFGFLGLVGFKGWFVCGHPHASIHGGLIARKHVLSCLKSF